MGRDFSSKIDVSDDVGCVHFIISFRCSTRCTCGGSYDVVPCQVRTDFLPPMGHSGQFQDQSNPCRMYIPIAVLQTAREMT